MIPTLKTITVVLCFCFTAFTFIEVNADDFSVIPFVFTTGEHNDNLLFNEDDEPKIDDFITTIAPGLKIEEKTERLIVNLQGQMEFLLYKDNGEFDREDQNFDGDINFRITPRLDLSAAALYTEDSRRDRDLEDTGLLILSNASRNRQNYTLSTNYDLSEKISTELAFKYHKDEYNDNEFVDNRSNTVQLELMRDFSDILAQTRGLMHIGYNSFDFTSSDINDTKIDTISIFFGVDHSLNEVLNVILNLGSDYYDSTFDSTTEDRINYDGWEPIGKAAISYRAENINGEIGIMHSLMVASGRSAITDRTALTFGINRRVLDRLRLGLTGGYYINKADQGENSSQDIDERTFRIQPRIRYDLNSNIALVAAYRYRIIDDKDDNLKRTSNLISVSLQIEYPIFE